MSPDERAALTMKLRGGAETKGIRLSPKTRVLAVASGKGGVGKSSLSVNLAAALAAMGHEVGVLDADIYGHSIPHMLGVTQKPVVVDQMIVPPVAHDLRLMSIGFFLDDNQPVMWRGPMLHRALEQFLQDVHWGELDVLVVDMPPGTGDVSISLGQLLPRAEAIIVTTPQPLAQEVASRAAVMAQKTGMRVVGVIENMTSEMFGSGGGAQLAAELGVPMLGSVPLDARAARGGRRRCPARHERSGVRARAGDPRAGARDRREPRRRLHEHPAARLLTLRPEDARPRLEALGFAADDVETLAAHFLAAEERGQAEPRSRPDRVARVVAGARRGRATQAGRVRAGVRALGRRRRARLPDARGRRRGPARRRRPTAPAWSSARGRSRPARSATGPGSWRTAVWSLCSPPRRPAVCRRPQAGRR